MLNNDKQHNVQLILVHQLQLENLMKKLSNLDQHELFSILYYIPFQQTYILLRISKTQQNKEDLFKQSEDIKSCHKFKAQILIIFFIHNALCYLNIPLHLLNLLQILNEHMVQYLSQLWYMHKLHHEKLFYHSYQTLSIHLFIYLKSLIGHQILIIHHLNMSKQPNNNKYLTYSL